MKAIFDGDSLNPYDPKGSREFCSRHLKQFGAEPPSKQLLPTPEGPFFARITDLGSPYSVAPDHSVFSGKIIVLANQNSRSATAGFTALMQDDLHAVIVGSAR